MEHRLNGQEWYEGEGVNLANCLIRRVVEEHPEDPLAWEIITSLLPLADKDNVVDVLSGGNPENWREVIRYAREEMAYIGEEI